MLTALVRFLSPSSHALLLAFVLMWIKVAWGVFLPVNFDLIISAMNGRPASWVDELSFHCNIWAGTSECWVPLETESWISPSLGYHYCPHWSMLLIYPAANENGSQPRKASWAKTIARERNPKRKMLIIYFDLVALEMASPTLATIHDHSPGLELLLDKERSLGLLLWLPS